MLSLTIGPHRDELLSAVEPLVAARRKVRRLAAELNRRTGAGVLAALSPQGGTVLLPSDVPARNWSAADTDRLRGRIAELSRFCGAALTAGLVPAAPDGVAAAAPLAAEVRAVAEACGRGPGVYRLADVRVEYQLTRPGPARDELAVLLRPLTAHPDLLETLRAFLACGLDRRRTAAHLQVHPNTVDYRLRRVAATTGLDAGRGEDIPTLHAALIAYTAGASSLASGEAAAATGEAAAQAG